MKTLIAKSLVAGGMALALLGGTAAEAASFDRGGRHDGDRGYNNSARHDSGRDHRGYDNRRFDNHRWSRGERLSPRYGSYVVVNDWNRYNLRRPPRGYHWVRYGNDYILAAIATGLIADLMYNGYGY